MKSVSEHGRTVLFVSHNMSAVAQLCTRGIVMKNGAVEYQGQTAEAVEKYLSGSAGASTYSAEDSEDKPTQILWASVVNREGKTATDFAPDDDITLKFKVKNFSSDKNLICAVSIVDSMDKILTVDCIDISPNVGYQTYKFVTPKGLLVPSKLKFGISLYIPRVKVVEIVPELLSFEVIDASPDTVKYGQTNSGVFKSNSRWTLIDE